jgi:sec-independent protein translocase protein TatC
MHDHDFQPFLSHLLELRSRLLRIALGIMLAFLGLFYWASDLYQLLALPLLQSLPKGGQMIATDVTTPFFVPMKVTLMAAFLLALPHTLYQVWVFIAPGLYLHEKKWTLSLIIAGIFLFFAGMLFAYFLVLPIVFHFITAVAPVGVAVMTDIDKYLSFVLGLFMAFGFTFEVPIIVILLTRFEIITLLQLKLARPYIIVGAFVLAAIITPPDVVSQIMLAIPLWLLFELGVMIAGWLTKPPQET